MLELDRGRSRAEHRARADALIAEFELDHVRQGLGEQLSGGETQRVAVARALVHDPAFVLADEPTGNLDSEASQSLMDLFASLHGEGRTIVVITHNESIASALPRCLKILDGRLEQDTDALAR